MQQEGFSLVEVLLSAALLSIGMAALAYMLMLAVADTSTASRQSTAAFLAQEAIAEARVANQFDQIEWSGRVARGLPLGIGILCHDSTPWDGTASQPGCEGVGTNTVKIFWAGIEEPGHRHVATR